MKKLVRITLAAISLPCALVANEIHYERSAPAIARTIAERRMVNLQGHTYQVASAEFSPDTTLVVTASGDQTAKLWNRRTGELVRTLEGHTDQLNCAQFSPHGTSVVTAAEDGTAKIWNVATGALVRELLHTVELDDDHFIDDVNDVNFSPDGTKLVTRCHGIGHLWGVNDGSLRTLDDIQGAEFSPDSTKVVTSSSDDIVRVWDVETGQIDYALDEINGLLSAHYSPDGNTLMTVDETTVRICTSSTGALLRTIADQSGWISGARYSPDGNSIITTYSQDGRAKLWNSQTGDLVRILEGGDENGLYVARFSADGRRVMARTHSTIYVWDVQEGTLIMRTTFGPDIKTAHLSPDGRDILVALNNNSYTAHILNTDALVVGDYFSKHTVPLKEQALLFILDGIARQKGGGVINHADLFTNNFTHTALFFRSLGQREKNALRSLYHLNDDIFAEEVVPEAVVAAPVSLKRGYDEVDTI